MRINGIVSYFWIVLLLVTVSFLSHPMPSSSPEVGDDINRADSNQLSGSEVKLPHRGKMSSDHDPISILSDQDFDYFAQQEGWVGTGSPANPFRISGYTIYTHEMDPVGITISDTTAHFIIENVEIYGSGESSEFGISFHNVANGQVNNSFLSDLDVGVELTSSNNLRIEGTTVENSLSHGFVLDDCGGVLMTGNSANYNNLNGFDIQNSSNMTLVLNSAFNNYADGFYVFSLSTCNLTSNSAQANIQRGFSIEESEVGYITNNQANENIGHGFYLGLGNAQVVVGSNNASLNEDDGFAFYNLFNSTVTHNMAYANSGNGFFFSFLNTSIVDGNEALFSQQSGFQSNDGYKATFSNNYAYENAWYGFYHHSGSLLTSTSDKAIGNHVTGFITSTSGIIGFHDTQSFDNALDFSLSNKQSLDFILPLGKQMTIGLETELHDYFVLYCNNQEVERGVIENNQLVLNIQHTTPGNYSYNLFLYVNSQLQGSFDVPVEVIYSDKPFVVGQEDVDVLEGSINNYLVWHPYGYEGGFYFLYLGDQLVEAQSWTNGLPIIYNIDHLPAGGYYVELRIQDKLGLRVEDLVFVSVYDGHSPELQELPDVQCEMTEVLTLSWIASDRNPWYFLLYLDEELVAEEYWSSYIPITTTFDTLTIGSHQVRLEVYDGSDNLRVDQVVLTVVDTKPPTVVSSVVNLNTTPVISWALSDPNPSYYEVFVQEELYLRNNWTEGEVVEFNVSSLDMGENNFTLVAFDSFGNYFVKEILLYSSEETSGEATTVYITSVTTVTEPQETVTVTETNDATSTTTVNGEVSSNTTSLGSISDQPINGSSQVSGYLASPLLLLALALATMIYKRRTL